MIASETGFTLEIMSGKGHCMSQIPPQKFGAEYVAHLRELLDIAAEQIGPEHRTLGSQAETAEAETHHITSTASPAGEDRIASRYVSLSDGHAGVARSIPCVRHL